jgi:hypothetical protein
VGEPGVPPRSNHGFPHVSALVAGASEHDVVLLHRVTEPPGRTLERALQDLVRERLDLAAVVADEVVVVVVALAGWLEARDAVADVHPLDESELGERVERPVDAGHPHGAAPGRDAVVDLLGGAAAVLRREEVDHGPSRSSASQSGCAQPLERGVDPGGHA